MQTTKRIKRKSQTTKRIKRRSIVIALIIGALFLASFPIWSYAAPSDQPSGFVISGISIPSDIAGYHVVFAQNAGDGPCLTAPELDLSARSSSIESFLSSDSNQISSIRQALHDLNLPGNINIGFVGPGVSRDSLIETKKQYNDATASGCPKLSTLNSVLSDKNQSIGTRTDVNAQSVYMLAPWVGSNQDSPSGYSALVNNIYTNTGSNRLIQSGLAFFQASQPNGIAAGGNVVWADDVNSLYAHAFGITYTVGHSYWFTNSYSSSSWWACGEDITVGISTYKCQALTDNGTYVIADRDTSVWAENANSSNNSWYTGFDYPWYAWGAQYYISGTGYVWSGDSHQIGTAQNSPCQISWATDTVSGITGDLINGDTANFNVNSNSKLPMAC